MDENGSLSGEHKAGASGQKADRAQEHLATYLNDHLAGAVVAIELLTHLEATHAGTPLERFFTELRADIEADRQELEAIMGRLRLTRSRTRRAAAWFTEKLTELKLRLDDPAGRVLLLFESLEALSLGIEGKRCLWLALAAAAENAPELRVSNYEGLAQRAQEQRRRVEELRLEAGRKALTASP